MAWQVVLCDDEAEICDLLVNFLDRLQADTGEKFQRDIFHNAKDLLGGIHKDTDIILLDIGMKGMNGMDAARELRARGNKSAIIFITSMVQYAIEGYEVRAFGFLCKPLEYHVFRMEMEDLLTHLRKTQNTSWEMKSGADTRLLLTDSILFLDAYGHNVTVHMTDNNILPCNAPLSVAEEQLENVGFFRCHKSYLINLKHVNQIDAENIVLSDKSKIPLSRHRRREFLTAFIRYREGI